MDSQQISKIIRSRIQGSAIIALFMFWGLFYGIWHRSLALIVIMGPFCILAAALCVINARNYPQPRLSYRKFNKLFYVQLMRISTILGLLAASKDVVEAGVTRDLEKLGEAGLEVAGSAVTHTNMKRGEIVEAYFEELQSAAQPPAGPVAQDLQTAAPASVAATIPAMVQHEPAVPRTVKTPWLAVGLVGAFMPTALIFLLIGAFLSSFSFGSSTFLLYSAAYGLNTVLGPLVLIGPYILVIIGLSWVLSFALKKLEVTQPGMTATIILFSAGAIDVICLGLNFGFAMSEIFVTIFGLFTALGALYTSEFPYGKTKKWIQYGIVAVLLVITYIGARLYWNMHH